MENLTVSKDFVLEAYKEACSEWKAKIEKEFPSLFPKKQTEVIEIRVIDGARETKSYKFEKGQVVQVFDGSYNTDVLTGEHRTGIDPLFRNNEAIIIGFAHDEWYNWSISKLKITLNLMVRFPNGTLVYVAPCCVRKY